MIVHGNSQENQNGSNDSQWWQHHPRTSGPGSSLEAYQPQPQWSWKLQQSSHWFQILSFLKELYSYSHSCLSKTSHGRQFSSTRRRAGNQIGSTGLKSLDYLEWRGQELTWDCARKWGVGEDNELLLRETLEMEMEEAEAEAEAAISGPEDEVEWALLHSCCGGG